jgi:uncharacterized membrane protein YuzA (DUF378 family)
MNYKKSISGVIATNLTATIAAMTSGPLTPISKINIAIAGLGACVVFAAPNVPHAPVTKAILAVLMAVLSFLVTVMSVNCPSLALIASCVSTANWLQVGVIAFNAVGVYAFPNTPPD